MTTDPVTWTAFQFLPKRSRQDQLDDAVARCRWKGLSGPLTIRLPLNDAGHLTMPGGASQGATVAWPDTFLIRPREER